MTKVTRTFRLGNFQQLPLPTLYSTLTVEATKVYFGGRDFLEIWKSRSQREITDSMPA